MKKTFILLMVLMVSAGGLFAQQSGQWTSGGRLGMAFGFNNSADFGSLLRNEVRDEIFLDTGIWIPVSVSDNMRMNFNFALYANHAFSDRLSLQAELNFMINQGYELELSVLGISETVDIIYSSLDIPILVRYTLINSPLIFGIQGGPHISIPLGDGEISGGGMSGNIPIRTSATFGLTAGILAGHQVGSGRIIGDMRFLFDFNEVEAREFGQTISFMQRRALLFTIGYEVSF